jgi:hypothetical protein
MSSTAWPASGAKDEPAEEIGADGNHSRQSASGLRMAYEYYILHVCRLDVGNQFGRDVLDRRLIGISPPLRATSGYVELQNPGRTVPGLPGQCFDCLLPDPATMAATMEKCEVTSAHSLLLDVRGRRRRLGASVHAGGRLA